MRNCEVCDEEATWFSDKHEHALCERHGVVWGEWVRAMYNIPFWEHPDGEREWERRFGAFCRGALAWYP